MSGASFWAQGSQTVKTTTTPTPVMTEAPPKLPNAVIEPKKSMLLKRKHDLNALDASANISGASNGMSKTTMPNFSMKTANWADSDDDDEFLTSFMNSARSPHMQDLQDTTSAKDSRIGELVSTVAAKDIRVEELENLLKEKNHRIDELETDVEVKAARVEEMQAENHKQYLQVQEFVAEIDEKDRRIHKLEQQLDESVVIIRELEMDSGSQTQVSTDDTDVSDEKQAKHIGLSKANLKGTYGSGGLETSSTKAMLGSRRGIEMVQVTPAIVSHATTEVIVSSEPAHEVPASIPSANSLFITEVSSKEIPGPVANLAEHPHYILPGTVKSLPPPPPAPKLKMGIDMSKFGKKHAFKPALWPAEPKKTSDTPVSSYGYSSKQRTKTDAIPTINPSSDIRTMTHAERVLFANGPEITVVMGNMKLATLAKYVLMQCSAKAYRHFTENSDATTMTFKMDSMDADAAKAHLQWMDEMTFQGRVYSLTLNGDEKNDVKNLNICRAARVLGINNIYVGHFTKTFCDRVRSQKASPIFIGLVADLAYLENDPIFECLANNLVNMRIRNVLPKGLEILVEKHVHLKSKMDKIEKRTMNKRKAEPEKVNGTRKSIIAN